MLYELEYDKQIENKLKRVGELLAPFYSKQIEVHSSATSHYRARAEFRIWHENQSCFWAMGNIQKNGVVLIDECPKVVENIDKSMRSVLEQINSSPKILKDRLFGIEFLSSTMPNETLMVMLYHRKLDEEWAEAARRLGQNSGVSIIGRSRKQKIVICKEYVRQELLVDGKKYTFRHYEGGFTQPNPRINEKMLTWAKRMVKSDAHKDMLEAYCGHGNFTIPLSDCFRSVLATEISKRSIASAKENSILNCIKNIEFVRVSSQEMTQALNREREFRRMSCVDLDSYNFTLALVDPPRSGLDDDTLDLISKVPNIIYISCNPETLARDLQKLAQRHRVQQVALFDQFPHTKHIECGVFLKSV